MLRTYRPSDREAAIALYIDCFENPPFSYDWLRRDAITRYFADMERTPGFIGFVYEDGDSIAAICVGIAQDYFACPAYEIKELLVDRATRGRGMGKAVMAGVESTLAKEGIEVISFSTAESLDAFAFYKKNGYAVAEGTVWMGKRIL